MASSPGKQLLDQYKEDLSINNYGTCPAMAPTAWNGSESPVTVRVQSPIRNTKKKGRFHISRSLDIWPPRLHFQPAFLDS